MTLRIPAFVSAMGRALTSFSLRSNPFRQIHFPRPSPIPLWRPHQWTRLQGAPFRLFGNWPILATFDQKIWPPIKQFTLPTNPSLEKQQWFYNQLADLDLDLIELNFRPDSLTDTRWTTLYLYMLAVKKPIIKIQSDAGEEIVNLNTKGTIPFLAEKLYILNIAAPVKIT